MICATDVRGPSVCIQFSFCPGDCLFASFLLFILLVFFCLFVCLFVFFCLFVCLFVFFACLFVCLFVCLFAFLFVFVVVVVAVVVVVVVFGRWSLVVWSCLKCWQAKAAVASEPETTGFCLQGTVWVILVFFQSLVVC